jgi:hypothetical protein
MSITLQPAASLRMEKQWPYQKLRFAANADSVLSLAHSHGGSLWKLLRHVPQFLVTLKLEFRKDC